MYDQRQPVQHVSITLELSSSLKFMSCFDIISVRTGGLIRYQSQRWGGRRSDPSLRMSSSPLLSGLLVAACVLFWPVCPLQHFSHSPSLYTSLICVVLLLVWIMTSSPPVFRSDPPLDLELSGILFIWYLRHARGSHKRCACLSESFHVWKLRNQLVFVTRVGGSDGCYQRRLAPCFIWKQPTSTSACTNVCPALIYSVEITPTRTDDDMTITSVCYVLHWCKYRNVFEKLLLGGVWNVQLWGSITDSHMSLFLQSSIQFGGFSRFQNMMKYWCAEAYWII